MLKLFNDLRYARFNSALARNLLGLFYRENRVYPILSGPTRGMRVRFHHGMNYHAVLGLWERESTDAVTSIIRALQKQYPDRSLVVADVGANLGMYSLLLARLVKEGGEVHAFEPAPDVFETLRHNILLNHLPNVTVIPKAVSDRVGLVTFYLAWHHHASSLNSEWAGGVSGQATATEVSCTTLDDYFSGEGKPYPDFIKIDIEGGAVYALKGCDESVARARPSVYIESHTPEEDRAICEFIARHNYLAYRLSDRLWVKHLNNTHPDPDGIWGNLLLFPAEQSTRFRSLFV